VYQSTAQVGVPFFNLAGLILRNSLLAGNGAHECYLRNGATGAGIANLITDNSKNDHDDAPCPGFVTSDDPALGPLAISAPGTTPTLKIPLTSSTTDS